ncbi:hypothetical protein BC831DRAFT_164672 [Entophlyctis helioformis]|nr:hypothetical protein BC831DRAFT_164672 [Entophlyctis helioformis]
MTEQTSTAPVGGPGQIKRNAWSYVTLSWLNPMLSVGLQRPLQVEDLPELGDQDKTAATADALDGFWSRFHAHLANPHETKPPSLAVALLSRFYGLVLLQTLLKIVNVLAAVALPVLIPQVLQVLSPVASKPTPIINNIYGISLLFFVFQVANSIAAWSCSSVELTLNMRVRSVLVHALYSKALRLSPKLRGEYSAGKLNTLIASDSARLVGVVGAIIISTTSLVQVVVAVTLLFLNLGLGPAGITIGFYVLTTGLQNLVMPFISANFKQYAMQQDQRTKTIREFLYGMKIIKYQAAEEYFQRVILDIRHSQIATVGRISIGLFAMFGGTSFQANMLPLVAFGSFVALGGKLDVSNCFIVLALMSSLIQPTVNINMSLSTIVEGRVSYKRISEFLLAAEAQAHETTELLAHGESKDGSAIKIDGGAFTWEVVQKNATPSKSAKKAAKKSKKDAKKPKEDAKDASAETAAVEETKQEPFKLEDINLSIPRGSLVAVVGSVGSGKSSFLSALIGGMRKTAGSSSVFGSIAYCAQEPWILTGTIEENIVFSDESVRPNIAKAVSASCLEHDLEILPNGLGTQIGEKGINLSGGQKARVALARAIARNADIYLLDDPIAALDAHVGKKVFDEAICGTLKSKTVVLVTHQLHLLPKVDFVVVLDNGRVAETGTFKDLMAVPESALSGIMKDYHFDDEDNKDDEEDKDEDEVVVKAVKEFEEQQAIAEDRRVGALKFAYVRGYFLAAGPLYFGLLVLILALTMAANALSQISLVLWTGNRLSWPDSSYLSLFIGASLGDVIIGLLQEPSTTSRSLVSSALPCRSLMVSRLVASSTA